MTEANTATKPTKAELTFNILALVCATWFLLTGSLWVYLINLAFGYPVFLLGLFFWYKAWKINRKSVLNKVAGVALLSGLICSAVTFYLFYFNIW